MLGKISNKVASLLRFYGHFRFREPILVLESDDWGLERNAGRLAELQAVGTPRYAAYDRLESTADLESLYQLLECFTDVFGHPYKLVANFIVENPDYETTIQSGFKKIYRSPIYEKRELQQKWQEGFQRRVFYPQYHGRYHFNVHKMERELRSDFRECRRIFRRAINDSYGNLEESADHNWSEYQDWSIASELSVDEQEKWIGEGLNIFRKTFGFASESTIAPHFVFTPSTIKAMQRCGIRYIQGGNEQVFKVGPRLKKCRRFSLGASYYQGVVMLSRLVKFEPARGNKNWDVEAVRRKIKWLFEQRVPVVIDTHRINYSGTAGDTGRHKLEKLLRYVQSFAPVVLSSDELGEAIAGRGVFVHRFSGEEVRLSPLHYPLGKLARNTLIHRKTIDLS